MEKNNQFEDYCNSCANTTYGFSQMALVTIGFTEQQLLSIYVVLPQVN